jgi:hypothetical protein
MFMYFIFIKQQAGRRAGGQAGRRAGGQAGRRAGGAKIVIGTSDEIEHGSKKV